MNTLRGEPPLILLLGPLQVSLDGAQRQVRGVKQNILLARLSLAAGRPIPIETLIEDLWEGRPPRDPGRALQVHVSRLRSALEIEIELVNGAAYCLAPECFDTDALHFSRLCDQARAETSAGAPAVAATTFTAALDLWRGAALGELAERGALRSAALRMEEERDRAVHEWAEACLGCGRSEDIISDLRASLDRDPLQEHRWRQLILALHRSGRHGEALAMYRQARETFIEEIGVAPNQMLAEVHAELMRIDTSDHTARTNSADSAAPPASRTPASQVPASGQHPSGQHESRLRAAGESGLVGRSVEFEILLNACRDSRDGLRVVSLSGEPGVGKTRLIAELAEHVSAPSARVRIGRVLMGRCDPTITSPFQPFAQMVRAYTEERLARTPSRPIDPRLHRHLPGLMRVLPELAEWVPGVRAHASRSHGSNPVQAGHEGGAAHATYEAMTAWLSILSEDAPLLVVIDDLHWADPETVQLLRHMIHSRRPLRALVVIALRDREIGRTAGNHSPQPALLAEFLRQSDRVTHLPLPRLDRAETAVLLAAESPATDPPAPSVVEHVRAASGGNPLFVVELARQLRTSPTTGPAIEAASGLRQVIESRVGALRPASQQLLRWAAALGSVFDPGVLRQLTEQMARAPGSDASPTRGGSPGTDASPSPGDSPGPADVDRMISETVHVQLVEPVDGAGLRFAFSHDVVRTVLYSAPGPGTRSALHGAIAEVLENRPASDRTAHHHEVAYHLWRCDLPDASTRAARHLLHAGRDELRRGASQNAVTSLRHSLDLLGPDADPALRCDLLIELGTAQNRCALPEHRRTLLEAAELARGLDDRERLIAAVLANSRGWWSSTVELDHERVAGIETALAMSEGAGGGVLARLLASWAMENVRDPGSRAEVLAASAEALRLAEGDDDDAALTMALARRYTVLYALFEQPAECLHLGERLLSIANRSGDRMTRLTASVCLAQASMRFGEFHLADRHTQQAVQLTRTLEQPARQWLVVGWQATRLAMRGHFDPAERLARENQQFGVRTEQADADLWFAGQLFTIRLLQDRLPDMVSEMDDQVTTVVESVPAWRAAMALVLAHSGGRSDAEAILEEFASGSFTQLPRDMLWLNGMSYLSMVCELVPRPDIAAEIYRALAPFSGMVASNGTIDSGPVDLRLGALADLTGERRLARQHLTDAVALCRRIDAPAWHGRATSLLERV